MKAKIIYISDSNLFASISIKQNIGPIVQNISGFVGLPEGHTHKIGDEIEIPASKVDVEVRISKEGEPFNWLRFS